MAVRKRAVFRVVPFVLVTVVVLAAPRASGQQRRLDGDALMATVRTLASPELEGRGTGSAGGLKARAWVLERFKAAGLHPLDDKHLFPFTFTHRATKASAEGANIAGLCRGTGKAPEMLVITAHYDHLGVRDGATYPGADDNASGVAVLLGIAEQCRTQPFQHDALFVAFDAEELGLQGARAFVANPPVPKARLGLNINLDMVSRSDKRELFAAGTYHRPALIRPLLQVASRAPIALRFGHDLPNTGMDDWTNQSDHGAFHAAGIPFVYFGVEDHADYHKPTDTADKIDPVFFRQAAETILDAVATLDAADIRVTKGMVSARPLQPTMAVPRDK